MFLDDSSCGRENAKYHKFIINHDIVTLETTIDIVRLILLHIRFLAVFYLRFLMQIFRRVRKLRVTFLLDERFWFEGSVYRYDLVMLLQFVWLFSVIKAFKVLFRLTSCTTLDLFIIMKLFHYLLYQLLFPQWWASLFLIRRFLTMVILLLRNVRIDNFRSRYFKRNSLILFLTHRLARRNMTLWLVYIMMLHLKILNGFFVGALLWMLLMTFLSRLEYILDSVLGRESILDINRHRFKFLFRRILLILYCFKLLPFCTFSLLYVFLLSTLVEIP